MALLTALILVSSCASILAASQITLSSISFKEIPVPEGDAINKYTGFTEVTIDGKTYNVTYTPLLESGKFYPSFTAGQMWQAGTILNINGKALTVADTPNADPARARNFDRTSIFSKFGKIWAFTHDEAAYGSLYLMELSQSNTGILTISKSKTVNLGSTFGTVRPCSGSLTPWKSHLLAEEYVLEAKDYPPASVTGFNYVHGIQNNETNPYWYGFMIEAAVTRENGATSVGKRYSMGRCAWETAVVLPDRKTVIGTDDISNGGVLLMFIADKAGDLRKGRLFAAAVDQLYSVNDGTFSIRWIHLNPSRKSVDEKTILNYVNGRTYQMSKAKFSTMFDSVPVEFLDVNKTQIDYSKMPAGFKTIKTEGTKLEWLRLKPGMGALASRLETRRMAAYMGATNEFTKLEGLIYDAYTNSLYAGLTAVQRSMTNSPTRFDLGGPNMIKLPENIAGAVYEFELNEKYQPKRMHSVLSGFGYNSSLSVNSVPQDSIASPDNVGFMSKYSTLLIGEDCGSQHLNNYMWAYNTMSKALTRIFAAPPGAEVTSPYYFPNIGNFSYLTATVQHPPEGVLCTVGYWLFPTENSVYEDVSF